ncbi:hypothetical protein Q6325_28015, partial [Klebsiella pneumoniae]
LLAGIKERGMRLGVDLARLPMRDISPEKRHVPLSPQENHLVRANENRMIERHPNQSLARFALEKWLTTPEHDRPTVWIAACL